MTDCRDFFSALDAECEKLNDSRIRGDRLRASCAGREERLREWELKRASEHSPRPVGDGEKLRLALFEGQHIVEGRLHKNSFQPLQKIGLSVDRCEIADLHVSLSRFRAMKKEKPLAAYVELEAAHLRSVEAQEAQEKPKVKVIGIYDTASKENTSHAEGFLLFHWSNSKPLDSVKANLMDRYEPRVVKL